MAPHTEHHFTAGEVVRDIIIGMSDGLTVPFALAAGLSGANAASSLVVTAGLAEVAAGAIAMGLGGYLAAKSDADHYSREKKREEDEILTVPDTEADEVGEILSRFGLRPHEYNPVVEALRGRPEDWLEFMMRKRMLPRKVMMRTLCMWWRAIKTSQNPHRHTNSLEKIKKPF
ncbi:hypothetical protein GOP47_0016942 [Adiantum capillus-veneris]|uniref:Vacuolar iron transporter 1 n=1 Tax=Adiantum capillus-veneris TaxID=13818 RepID=A0A9D4UJ04_ADICA|nr:hypothetical protein GOP47_0016942 [Adiantum capillus-veneris]